MATTTATNSFVQRLIGALALDVAIYEEVEADASATTQAFAVVLLSSLAAGLGAKGLGDTSVVNIAFMSVMLPRNASGLFGGFLALRSC